MAGLQKRLAEADAVRELAEKLHLQERPQIAQLQKKLADSEAACKQAKAQTEEAPIIFGLCQRFVWGSRIFFRFVLGSDFASAGREQRTVVALDKDTVSPSTGLAPYSASLINQFLMLGFTHSLLLHNFHSSCS